jgi:sec-independent protein translocase protein TatA
MGEIDTTLAFLGPIGWPELAILGLLGVLIFGKRLPEVGKSIGKGIVEFKKGVSGISEEINEQSNKQSGELEDKDDSVQFEGSEQEAEPASKQSSSNASTSTSS